MPEPIGKDLGMHIVPHESITSEIPSISNTSITASQIYETKP
jgi:hypothetical protein